MAKSNLKKIQRNDSIDLLRGIAIIIMIFIHTSAYFLSYPLVKTMWNLSQFVVVTFIFCSGYLYFQKSQKVQETLLSFSYVTKRIWRLFIPYYIFLFFYSTLLFLTTPEKLSLDYIFKSMTVTGGVDLSWLVLLFTYVMILLPIVDFLAKKSIKLFYTYFFMSLFSSIFLLFFKSPVYFRYSMWLPWSLVLYFSWYVAKYEKSKQNLLKLFVFSVTAFFISILILQGQHKSLIHFENKYPPNLFHISYGVFMTLLLYVGLNITGKLLQPLKKIINFFSFYSYPIFFVHFFILFAIDTLFKATSFHWISLFLIVTAVTVILIYLFSTLKRGPTI